jgi:hypothetical protein
MKSRTQKIKELIEELKTIRIASDDMKRWGVFYKHKNNYYQIYKHEGEYWLSCPKIGCEWLLFVKKAEALKEASIVRKQPLSFMEGTISVQKCKLIPCID